MDFAMWLPPRRQCDLLCPAAATSRSLDMTQPKDIEARVAALEATVRALKNELADLRKSLPQPVAPANKPLRSRGMLDRPATRK